MRANKSVLLPALLVAIVCVLLIAYSFYAMKTGDHPRPPEGAGMERPPVGKEEEFEPFQFLGTLAVICGGISFLWLRFKKKLSSPSLLVKKWARMLHAVHQYAGWAALAMILVHGAYYLIVRTTHPKIFSGLAAFLILLGLALYGMLIKRVRNPLLRKAHFWLSIAWVPALLLHAGGSFITMALATVAIWGLAEFFERTAKTSPSAAGG